MDTGTHGKAIDDTKTEAPDEPKTPRHASRLFREPGTYEWVQMVLLSRANRRAIFNVTAVRSRVAQLCIQAGHEQRYETPRFRVFFAD